MGERLKGKPIFKYIIAAQAIIAVVLALLAFAGARREVTLDASQLSAEAGELRNGARYIDDSYGYQGYFTSTPQLTLPRGSYTVKISLASSADYLNVIETRALGGSALFDEKLLIPAADGELEFDLWVTSREAAVSVKTFYQFGALSVRGVTVAQNGGAATSALALFVLLCALGDTVYFLYTRGCVKTGGSASRAAFFALAAIIALSSLPLLQKGIKEGHDLLYHLMRIEGVADALRHGLLPARVYPFVLGGSGYASGLFYPDLFLYPSALLRLCGLPLQYAYKFLVLIANTLTAVCGYFGFKAIFKKRAAGVAGAAFMSFASYRLVNVWLRSAVGEHLAMAFFPLVLAALWLLLREPTDSPDFKRGVLYGVIGYSGVIQSHIISCELIGLFTAAFCVVCVKRLFEKKRLLALLKTAGLTLALNAWFILPLLDALRGDYAISSGAAAGVSYTLAEQALYPLQLFKINGRCAGLSLDLSAGAQNEMPLSIGLLLMVCAVVFIAAIILRKGRFRFARAGLLALAGAAALMFMTTYLFPWRFIEGLPVIGALASVMQFPWRLLSLISLLLAFVGCAALSALDERRYKIAAIALLSAAAVVQAAFFFSAYVCNYTVYDTPGLGNAGIGNGEYLPVGCDISSLAKTAAPSEDIEITAYQKDGLSVSLSLANNSGEAGSVTLPLLYYPGYSAHSSGGETLELAKGDNGALAVEVPPRYDGELEISYVGKPLWHVSEAVSLLTLAACAVAAFKRKKEREESDG